MKTKTPYQKPGYTTVSPYLLVDDLPEQVQFLLQVFQGEPDEDPGENTERHAEIRLGDTKVMIGKANENWPPRKGMNYIYVDDLDGIFERARALGARILMEPADQDYGDRMGGFEDSQGNQWWCARYQPKDLANQD